jgi:hypothetical protein
MARRLTDHQKSDAGSTPVQRLVRLLRRYFQTCAHRQYVLHPVDLHRQFTRQHIEKLPRELVPMPLLRSTRRHPLSMTLSSGVRTRCQPSHPSPHT